ncbi:MAG TPA: SDR family NAD(P)-dependent oxidoreductase [Candidatus Gracilibacteria bacterium]
MPYALITGGTSGIGLAAARIFAQRGFDLILVGRRKERLASLEQELATEYTIKVKTFAVDVTEKDAVDKMFEDLSGFAIKVLVNNAGLALGKSPFQEAAWSDLEQMIDVNIKGFTQIALRSIPFLKATKGHMFQISSIAGIEAYEGGHVYCATKSFVAQMTRALRIDLAGSGIRVTDIAPGAVETEFSQVRFKGDQAKATSVYEGYTPLSPDDIAQCMAAAYDLPHSVNVQYMLVMPTDQASATRICKS